MNRFPNITESYIFYSYTLSLLKRDLHNIVWVYEQLCHWFQQLVMRLSFSSLLFQYYTEHTSALLTTQCCGVILAFIRNLICFCANLHWVGWTEQKWMKQMIKGEWRGLKVVTAEDTWRLPNLKTCCSGMYSSKLRLGKTERRVLAFQGRIIDRLLGDGLETRQETSRRGVPRQTVDKKMSGQRNTRHKHTTSSGRRS